MPSMHPVLRHGFSMASSGVRSVRHRILQYNLLVFSCMHGWSMLSCFRLRLSGLFFVHNTFYASVSPPRFDRIDNDMYPTEGLNKE